MLDEPEGRVTLMFVSELSGGMFLRFDNPGVPKSSLAAESYQAGATRRYWSGPSRLEQRILRAYVLTAQDLGMVPCTVLDERYRRRQRARVKRRRR
jgi:lambda repressor-like predicted transcriptional regulator